MDDGQGGAISTSGGGRNPKLRRLLIIQGLCSDLGFSCGEKAGRLSHASGAGTLSLPDLPLDRSLGRSEEHTSELQSRLHLVCRLLLEKKKRYHTAPTGRSDSPQHPDRRLGTRATFPGCGLLS